MSEKKRTNYAYVMALSKRAREIVENHEDSCKEFTVKPVKMAEDEFAMGKFVIDDSPVVEEVAEEV